MFDQDRIMIMLTKYVAGELTREEREELDWAMEADSGIKDMFHVILGLKEMPPGGLSASEEQEALNRGLRRITAQPGEQMPWQIAARSAVQFEEQAARQFAEEQEGQDNGATVRRMPVYRWMAAASLLILILAGGILYTRQGHKPDQATAAAAATHPMEIATKYGTRTFVDLPDGSKLWLNAGSKALYADGFAGGKRELTLSGEGYFDVKHDPEHPFIIHTGKVDVKVLGTSVNVKAYPGDSTMETTLIRGRVELDYVGENASGIVGNEGTAGNKGIAGNDNSKIQMQHNLMQRIIMMPNEKVTIRTIDIPDYSTHQAAGPIAAAAEPMKFSRNAVTPDPAYKTIIETSWVEDKLVFRNLPFEEVAMRLERWYNIRFHFENNKYLKDSLTGYFKDQPIRNVMDALRLTLGFHYEISGDTVRIW